MARVQAWQHRARIWIVEDVLGVIHLQPVYLLHSVDLSVQQRIVHVVVLEHSQNCNVHLLQLPLSHRLLASQLTVLPRLVLDDFPQRLQVDVHVPLDWRQQLDHNFLDELSLQVVELRLVIRLLQLLQRPLASLELFSNHLCGCLHLAAGPLHVC